MKIKLGALKNLIEAAVQPSEAASQGLAMSIVDRGQTVNVIAYDPFNLTNAVVEELNQSPRLGVMDALRKVGGDHIVGTIDLRHSDADDGPCHGAYIIQTAAARQGYGPLTYDLALSLGRPVIPDRTSVSPYARKVWKKYFHDRGDVVKLPLDNKFVPKTKAVEDDCVVYPEEEEGEKLSGAQRLMRKLTGGSKDNEPKDVLNYAYEAGSKSKYSAMLQNNDRALPYFNDQIKKIGKRGISESMWEQALYIATAHYFNKRYGAAMGLHIQEV